jgi:hypothetical protein
VNIFHRDDMQTPHPVVLDPSGTDTEGDHNPELAPGDTVQVSRAGLVYVVGDVVRPGGFPVDPAQALTVVQALTLAWGPLQNAANGKALLIREQKSGRTITTLNLKRMIHGQDPDQPVHDRDILYVPSLDSQGSVEQDAGVGDSIGGRRQHLCRVGIFSVALRTRPLQPPSPTRPSTTQGPAQEPVQAPALEPAQERRPRQRPPPIRPLD